MKLQPLPQARRNIAGLMRALTDAQRGERRITPAEARAWAGALLTLDAQAATVLGITEKEGTR